MSKQAATARQDLSPGTVRRLFSQVCTQLLAGIIVVLSIWGCAASARAQVDTGSIQGIVADGNGARIPSATVTVQNTDTGVKATRKSDANGEYLFDPISVGSYSITAEATGFGKEVQTAVKVLVQQHVVANLTLRLGSVETEVQVSATGELLQTQDASLGQTVEGNEIVALPLNGRNFTMLAQTAPGVTTTQQESRNLIFTGSFVSNGVPSIYNDYLLDGIDNNSYEVDYLSDAAYVVRPPVDAILEFKVQTGDFSAEFGRSAGAVLNAVTRSGANHFYGHVWEYVRDSALDGTDYFVKLNGQQKGSYTRNQFGFTLGGPVILPHLYSGKDRTFFFIDYEGTRIHQAVPYTSTVPTALEKSSGFTNYQDLLTQGGTQKDLLGRTFPLGTVFDPATTRPVSTGVVDPTTGLPATGNGFAREPFANNMVPSTRIDPIGVRLLSLYPAPTGSGITSNYFSQPIKTDNDGEYDARVDHTFSSKDTMFGRFSYNSEPQFYPAPLPGLAVGTPNYNVGNQSNAALGSVLSETHTFSQIALNEFRVGYKRLHSNRTQPFYYDNKDYSAQLGVPGVPYAAPAGSGLPEFNIGGLTLLGAHNSLPSNEINAEFQVLDNVSLQLRKHALRFGIEYDRLKVAAIQPTFAKGYLAYSGAYTTVPSGNTASTGIAQLAILPQTTTVANGISSVGGANQVELSSIFQEDYRRPAFDAYIQDDWRVTSKLTLNLGLRYEYSPLATDHFGHQANFVPAKSSSQATFMIDDRSRNTPLAPSFLANLATDDVALVYSANHKLGTVTVLNFAPRVGFAYRLAPRLVVRGAYGIFYAGIWNQGEGNNLGDNYPFGFTLNYTPSNGNYPITPNNSIGLTGNGLSNVVLTPANINANGISLVGQQYNWSIPRVEESNLSTQYALSKSDSVTFSGVYTGGRHLNVGGLYNKPTTLLPTSIATTNYVPDPQFAVGMPYSFPEGGSYYYALQAQYFRQLSTGLTINANYTWSQNKSDDTDNLFLNSISYRAPNVPYVGIHYDYGYSTMDIRNLVHITSTYTLPFGRGQKFLSNGKVVNTILGGWSTSGLVTLQSGTPLTVSCSITTGTSNGCWALRVPGVPLYANAHTITHWMNAAAFANPSTVSTIGQTNLAPLGGSSGQVVGPRFHRGDASFAKTFPITEMTGISFRADVFNITNTPNFAEPSNLNFGTTATFGQITATRDNPSDPREIQLSINCYFGGPK